MLADRSLRVGASLREPHVGYFASKRALDLVVGGSALVLSLPLMVVVAILIRLESRGPALYRHRRVGEGGKVFLCYKFRSMHLGAASQREQLRNLSTVGGPVFKAPHDPRVTRLGGILRKTSIDELPQLINVLRGHLSLVGPRPLALEDFDARTEHIVDPELLALVESRLQVKPGITGIWQVSGRSSLSFDTWMRLDEAYIQRRSLIYDLYILMRTVGAVLLMRGAM